MVQMITKKRIPVFPRQLYDMLEGAEAAGTDHILSWSPDGRSFRIHLSERDEAFERRFVGMLKSNSFKQTRYRSFLRQLQLYGFERTFKGPDKGVCRHPLFVRGRRGWLDEKSLEDFQTQTNAAGEGISKRLLPSPDRDAMFLHADQSNYWKPTTFATSSGTKEELPDSSLPPVTTIPKRVLLSPILPKPEPPTSKDSPILLPITPPSSSPGSPVTARAQPNTTTKTVVVPSRLLRIPRPNRGLYKSRSSVVVRDDDADTVSTLGGRMGSFDWEILDDVLAMVEDEIVVAEAETESVDSMSTIDRDGTVREEWKGYEWEMLRGRW